MGKRISVYLTNDEMEILERLEVKNVSRFIKDLIQEAGDKINNDKCNTKT